LKNSGIYNLRFAPSWIYSWIFRKSFLRCNIARKRCGNSKRLKIWLCTTMRYTVQSKVNKKYKFKLP
jgi:hypothetical protein